MKNSLAFALLLYIACDATGFPATAGMWCCHTNFGQFAELADTVKAPDPRPARIPKRAALYSLVLPGAGQVYNGNWWKVPIVYGALGGALAMAINSQNNYDTLQFAYQLKLKGEPHPFSNSVLDDARRLRVLRDRYDKQRQTWYFLTVAVYGLQAVEALVDAHLQNFDVDEDLSLRIKPTLGIPGPGGMAPGIVFTLRLH